MIITKEIVTKFSQNINPKSVLDLGCGFGRFSLKFAKKGSNVTGIDIKEMKIDHDNFNFVKSDIREFEFKDKYDLIIASYVLHFFRREKAEEIIQKMKKSTEIGGYNILVCMSDEDGFYNRKPNNFYPSMRYLRNIYSDWEIVESVQDFTALEEHDGLPPHKHNLIILLIKKLS